MSTLNVLASNPSVITEYFMQGSTATLVVLRKASFSHASMININQGYECVCNKYQEVTDINIGIEL